MVLLELQQHKNITVLAENVQIQKNKVTLGELDCLILHNNEPIHLEIVYKFYLYDDSVGTGEIDHFVGPNRKDAFIEKLKKLKHKQLPILHNDACRYYLEKLDLQLHTITQQVYFMAQLFLPYNSPYIKLELLNNACVVGLYIKKNELNVLKGSKFYIPIKKDWLMEPTINVSWINYEQFLSTTLSYGYQKFSTLFWLKLNNGELKKLFLVWW